MIARHGMAWYGKERHGMARHGMAWKHMARQGMQRQGMGWHGMEKYGMARQGKTMHLDTFYYIFVIIFNPLGLDVLSFFFGRIDIWMWSS